MKRILLMDPARHVRTLLHAFLQGEPSLNITCDATCPREGLSALRSQTFELVITEFDEAFVRAIETVPCLVFSGCIAESTALTALRAGAHGYLSKSTCLGEFLAAVHAVSRGERYLALPTRLLCLTA